MFSEVHQKVYASQAVTISFQPTKDGSPKEEDHKELNESVEKINQFFGYFYKIKSADDTTLGYLVGSVHLCNNKVFEYVKSKLTKAINKSTRLFLELESPSQSLKSQFEDMCKVLQESYADFTEAVSRYECAFNQRQDNFEWEKIKQEKSFSTCSAFEQFKLCYNHAIFIIGREVGKRGEEVNIEGVDGLLEHIFMASAKKIIGFEKASELSTELYDEAIQRNARDILYPDIEERIGMYQCHSQLWLQGQKIDIHYVSDEDLATNKEAMNSWNLICGRSIKFGQTILEDLKIRDHGRALYTVGVGHFYDQKNVIASLESHGFKVIRQ